MLDSEKNLRVLWVRALLASAGELEDDVAISLLPAASRWLVGPVLAPLWSPVIPKLKWISQRSEFIDAAIAQFLEKIRAEGFERAQVVLLGAGYDTRALRYRATQPTLDFYEVDLPDVISVREKLTANYVASLQGGASGVVRSLSCDLNKEAQNCFSGLEGLGLDPEQPTLVLSEAVLFYLSPPAKRTLLAEAAATVARSPFSSLVITDNLAPFVRSPKKEDTAAFLDSLGESNLKLREHDSLWGGAIQFVHAGKK